MPYSRATLTALKSQILSDIKSQLPGTDPLLRFSNLNITGVALANLVNSMYGYLDWISKQSVPYTATDEFMYAWGALKGVTPKIATAASDGVVTFTGADGSEIPIGTVIVRGDGETFTTTESDTVSGGSASVAATADNPGIAGNTGLGVSFTFDVAIAGINSSGTVTTAFTNGTAMETADSFRTRMLSVYQNPPQGGSSVDYINWALSFSTVTRAWVNPNGMGAGSVIVYVMMDITNESFAGFPQGTAGVATEEQRGVAATGDLLDVADFIYPLRPATALVYAAGPTPDVIDIEISGLFGASAYVKSEIEASISTAIKDHGTASGGSIDIKQLEVAIASVSGSDGFIITSPTENVITAMGHLPVIGTVDFI